MSARILVVDDSATIRKVVAAILSAHAFEPLLAADGAEALALLETETVDLVLLDFVMPRMNGYQFCRELRASKQHHALPVVLMSAKGDKIRGQFVQQTGAIDAIAKPFDARGLIAVVEGALKKQQEGRGRPVPEANAMPAEAALDRPSRLSDDPGVRRFHAALEFAQALERVIGPDLERELPSLEHEALRVALGRAITPETLASLSTLIKALGFGSGAREALAGDLSVISIAEVLQMLDLQRQSGALSIHTRKQEITLFIRDGTLDWSSAHGLGDEFLLGRYLLETGNVDREELNDALEQHTSSRRLIGERMVELGLVSEDQVRRALVRQASELLYEVVRWQKGRFSFMVGTEHPLAQKSALRLETGSLVMEGFRRVDEWRLIEGSFNFDEVLYPDPMAIERLRNENHLTRKELSVLEAIDGARTIREIVGEMGGSSFDLCKIVFQFLNSRLVRKKAA
jgi:DNA-binding response OmpR family regulator